MRLCPRVLRPVGFDTVEHGFAIALAVSATLLQMPTRSNAHAHSTTLVVYCRSNNSYSNRTNNIAVIATTMMIISLVLIILIIVVINRLPH